jgi:cytochrome c556
LWRTLAFISVVSKGMTPYESAADVQKAIAQNTSLSTLLEQARDEHPLASQEGLTGTAWDPEQREKS